MSVKVMTKITKQDIDKGIEQGLIAVGTRIITEAKSLSPVKDGRLRNSIMWTIAGQDGGFDDSGSDKIRSSNKKNELYVGSAVEYAPWQEYGTRYMSARPFLRPAIKITQGKNPDDIRDALEREFQKAESRRGR